MDIIVTAVGKDRPGLTQSLAAAIQDAGGNWLESHFARLGGQYVGSVLVELPDNRLADLERAAADACDEGFTVGVLPAMRGSAVSGQPLAFDVVAKDRPGIVRELATALAALDVNIEDLQTSAEDGAMFGDKLFRAHASVLVPPGTALENVRAALENISGDLMVDFEESVGKNTGSRERDE